LKFLAQHLEAIEASIAALDQEIATVHAQNPISRLLAGIPGIGKLAASANVASVPDPKVFKSGRDFSAWLGSTPRQNSSGGKAKLGSMLARIIWAVMTTGETFRMEIFARA
jgi:transposase